MAMSWNTSQLLLSLQTWASDVRAGFVVIAHHGLALFGLLVVIISLGFLSHPYLETVASEGLLEWLQTRQKQTEKTPATMLAATRLTTHELNNLAPDQVAVTRWLSRKYRVSSEPMGVLVAEAWSLGLRSQTPPSLILAIMAVESRFNPFASASEGKAGLMQLQISAHADALDQFGGPLSAFDPLTNLSIAVRHFQSLRRQVATNEEALAIYAASSGTSPSKLYVQRVLAEQKLLDRVAAKASKAALPKKPKRQ